MNSFRWRGGQTIAEYLLIFAVVSAAILGMQVYAKRGIQAAVKTAADRMSPVAGDTDGREAQRLGIRQESGDTKKEISSGSVRAKTSAITTTTNQTRVVTDEAGGKHTTVEDETTQSTGTSTLQAISEVK